jgi:hypothetical protein
MKDFVEQRENGSRQKQPVNDDSDIRLLDLKKTTGRVYTHQNFSVKK